MADVNLKEELKEMWNVLIKARERQRQREGVEERERE